MSDDLKQTRRAGIILTQEFPNNPRNFIRVDALKEEQKKLNQEIKEFNEPREKRLEEIKAELREEDKRCNHINEDGTTAWKGHFMFSSCDICGEDDL